MKTRLRQEVKEKNRVITYLTRDYIEKLDQLGLDAQFSAGVKIPRSSLLAMWPELLCRLDIRADGIKTWEEFYDRIRLAWNERSKDKSL